MNLSEIKRLMGRRASSHKGENGRVLVVGGSQDYSGTLVLVGVAALRAGADIVTIAAPQRVAWAVNACSPDLITKKLTGKYLVPRHISDVKKLLPKFDVLEYGNGIGMHAKTWKFSKRLAEEARGMKKVIDADGIKQLSFSQLDRAIITPHEVELFLFLKNSGLEEIYEEKNKERRAKLLQLHVGDNVLLIKGPTDYVISRSKIARVRGGNPGLTKAGTGDVLAGLCAGFYAQSGDAFSSARAASVLNKRIGDLLLKKKRGYSFIASDILDEIERLSSKGLL
ncbi:NAD(P)H-hydrate dehydratase [Candidatus Woesearchaeota archaeon]|nr:MAG: NAD(P)H-hydrate dehydratase [Candidatus Woesearchaeota archaeon]